MHLPKVPHRDPIPPLEGPLQAADRRITEHAAVDGGGVSRFVVPEHGIALGVLLHQQDFDALEIVPTVDHLIEVAAGLTGGGADLAPGGLAGDQHLVAAVADHAVGQRLKRQ